MIIRAAGALSFREFDKFAALVIVSKKWRKLNREQLKVICNYFFLGLRFWSARQIDTFVQWLQETDNFRLLMDVVEYKIKFCLLNRHTVRRFRLLFERVKRMTVRPVRVQKLTKILDLEPSKLAVFFSPRRRKNLLLLLLELDLGPLHFIRRKLPRIFTMGLLISLFFRLEHLGKQADEVLLKWGYLGEDRLAHLVARVSHFKQSLSAVLCPTDLVTLTLSYF